MSELKRCPFCASIPTTEVRVTKMGGGEDIIDFTVICKECGTYKTERLRIKYNATFMDIENIMAKVIEVWNMRAKNDNTGND